MWLKLKIKDYIWTLLFVLICAETVSCVVNTLLFIWICTETVSLVVNISETNTKGQCAYVYIGIVHSSWMKKRNHRLDVFAGVKLLLAICHSTDTSGFFVLSMNTAQNISELYIIIYGLQMQSQLYLGLQAFNMYNQKTHTKGSDKTKPHLTPEHQLNALVSYKRFTVYSNNTWQKCNPTRGNPRKVSIGTQLQSIQLAL